MSENVEQVMTEILTDLENRGNVVSEWPADEAKAYRKTGGFLPGLEAVKAIRIRKAAARIQQVIDAARVQAYGDGVSESQYMTGFTDKTFQAVMDKCEYRPQGPVNQEQR